MTADTQPGNYYVSCVNGPRTALLAGPFRDDHAAALAMVDRARQVAESVDPYAVFYSFGTVRLPEEFARPGRLNHLLGL